MAFYWSKTFLYAKIHAFRKPFLAHVEKYYIAFKRVVVQLLVRPTHLGVKYSPFDFKGTLRIFFYPVAFGWSSSPEGESQSSRLDIPLICETCQPLGFKHSSVREGHGKQFPSPFSCVP